MAPRPATALRHLAIGLILPIAACAPPPDNPIQHNKFSFDIVLKAGLNCWNGQCFSYHPRTQMVSVPGRIAVPLAPPPKPGMLSPAGFRTALAAARMAPPLPPAQTTGDDDPPAAAALPPAAPPAAPPVI